MAFSPGTRLGPFEIVSAIGAGGMGEVYRAKDTKLNRDVAIKVLPESFALDADRVARFTREAQVLASLNHPNIAAIYGIETNALVMELVEGEDLSAIIARGPVALADALPIAKQIADALEAAHEQGIVHRDLKPQNIKVRADGTVKVLDFGLAKAMDPAGASGTNIANSPTMTSPVMTGMGMILGTAAYMSPEQAKGRVVDKRADIWAFGAVLYEMLSGARAFRGDDVSDLLVAVLSKDVDLAALPASTPRTLTELIQHCLTRDPKQRLRDIGDARMRLDEVARRGGRPDAPATAAPPLAVGVWGMAALAGAALAIGLSGGWWLWHERGPLGAETPAARLSVLAPAGVTEVQETAMAPDGTFVVFVGVTGSTQQLYLHRLDEFITTPIAGTEGADVPLLSHDGKWIGFSRANHFEKIAVAGGNAARVAELPSSNPGYSWGSDDTILVTPNWNSGLSAISAAGGPLRTVTTLDTARGETGHWYPQFLPDGRHALFTIYHAGVGALNDAEIAVVDVSTGKYQVLMRGAHASYVAPGFLLFFRAGAYQAVRFDLDSLTASGDAVSMLTEDRGISPDGDNPALSVANNGTVSYVPTQFYPAGGLAWIAGGGAVEPLPFAPRNFTTAQLSPNGRTIAAGLQDGGRYVIRLLDLDRHTDDLLDLPGSNWRPIWHPDGRRLAMRTMVNGNFDIYTKDITTSAPQIKVMATPFDEWPAAWLSDHAMIIGNANADGLYRTHRIDPSDTANPVLLSENNPDATSVSPGGKWLAIADTHSGRSEVYVRRPSGDGIPERITASGGRSPVFLRNGRDLLYLRGQDVIAVSWSEAGDRFIAGHERVWAHLTDAIPLGLFDGGADNRVLLSVPTVVAPPPQVRIILNWQNEIARKLGR